MKMKINGREVEFTSKKTVLEVALENGINIPHLCYLPSAKEPYAGCRLCLVEEEGKPRPVTSCTLEAREGMSVRTHTERLLRHRRNIMEMILANHPNDCLYCNREGRCELQKIAAELGLREQKYHGAKRRQPVDVSSAAIIRDPNKCVLCGRCVTVCQNNQKAGILEVTRRGFLSRVSTGFYEGLGTSPCIACGQCIKACPTGALSETGHLSRVLSALGNTGLKTVFQIAPSIPVTVAGELRMKNGSDPMEKITGALSAIGAYAVFDTTFAADLTVMEEASELIKRIKTKDSPLPMFTSCSPGWVRYVENNYPKLIPHLSTCKSPQQMAAVVIKRIYAPAKNLKPEEVFSVSVMPCTAKKMEAEEFGDIDAVLTTREFLDLFKMMGVDLNSALPAVPLADPMNETSGAGRIFGATGGVMEAALRTAHYLLTGENITEPIFTEVRGEQGIREAMVKLGPVELRCCVINGVGNVQNLLKQVSNGESVYDFIEVMTCPGGCVAGGGQPLTGGREDRKYARKLYQQDKNMALRFAHENPAIKKIYDQVFGQPLSHLSHEMLHRSYRERKY